MKYIVGIDEVGRGPLAGPVTVGIVVCERKLYARLKRNKNLPISGKDSKKLSAESRRKYSDYLNGLITTCRSTPSAKGLCLQIKILHISNKIIDDKGIVWAIKSAIVKGIKKLKLNPIDCAILLDGGLSAPAGFKNQKTIIKGDEKEKIIAWASIVAKVSRDGLMVSYDRKFPGYNFKSHKGYGTAEHRRMIRKYDLSDIHRKSFCQNIFV